MIRTGTLADGSDLPAILNEIIARGGTTAYEKPLTREQAVDEFIAGPG